MSLLENGPCRARWSAGLQSAGLWHYWDCVSASIAPATQKCATRTMSTQNALTRLLDVRVARTRPQGAEEPVSHRSSPISTPGSDPGVNWPRTRGRARPVPLRFGCWGVPLRRKLAEDLQLAARGDAPDTPGTVPGTYLLYPLTYLRTRIKVGGRPAGDHRHGRHDANT